MTGLVGSVLVTGGAGYLGRGLMRRAQREHWDCDFTIYSRDEEKQRKAREKYKARYVLGDILDNDRLGVLMAGHDIVISAAAAKYIPQAEQNPSWCIATNIDGTRSVLTAARRSGVKQVVVVSTDKAPSPANVYGATKLLCERLVGESFDSGDSLQLVACRYGNVVGSTGSVWPAWSQQAEQQGHIQLTDPSMTRYMMSIDEAVDIITAGLSITTSGLVVLPSPRAVNMGGLARYVAHVLGVDLQEIGPRPGEKTHERMVAPDELRRLRQFASGDYFCLLPPGYESGKPIDFDIDGLESSEHPRTWLSPEEFVEIASDSESV